MFANMSVVAQLAWIHLALIAVPLLIAMMDLEWHDWRAAHPVNRVRSNLRRVKYFDRHSADMNP